MGIRPARCYHHLKRPNTRFSKRRPKKSYVKGVPDPKIHHFDMGNLKGAMKFPSVFHLVLKGPIQLRHNALEAARVSCNKYLSDNIGIDNYFMKIRIFPHHVMRENPLATGAGADRFSTGMQKAYGKPIGRAARVRTGQEVITVRTIEGKDAIVKEALRRAKMKLSGLYRIKKE